MVEDGTPCSSLNIMSQKREEPCPRCRERGADSRGDNLVVWPDGSAHCFSCNYHQFPKHYVPRLKELNVAKALLPSDFTREVPAQALKWLLQYGLPWSYWKDQIGYSPSEERLVFLVGSPTQFSIGRYVGNSSQLGMALPERPPRKWYVWGDSHRHAEIVGAAPGSDNPEAQDKIVLCEDLVSAHKIANAGYIAMPLFGVNWHPCHVYYLMQEQRPVVLWLDKDQAGTIMRKAVGLQALVGCPVRTVVTDNDPKSLSFTEIKQCLNMF